MPVISVEHLSKTYRLGQVSTGSTYQLNPANWQRDLFVRSGTLVG